MVNTQYQKRAAYSYLESEIAKNLTVVTASHLYTIATVAFEAATSKAIMLCATISWKLFSCESSDRENNIIFKIWRNSPAPDTLIFSIKDSCIEAVNSTAFTHVDTYSEASKKLKYILTAEASNGKSILEIMGEPIFTATSLSEE